MLKLGDFNQDTAYRQAFAKLLSTISQMALSAGSQQFNEVTNQVMQQVMAWSEFPRVGFFTVDNGAQTFSIYKEFHPPALEPILMTMKNMPFDFFPFWIQRINSGELLHIPDVTRLPESAKSEISILQSLNIRSGIARAIKQGTSIVGFVAFIGLSEARVWTEDDGLLLNTAGALFSQVLYRQRDEAAMRQREDRLELTIGQLEKGMEEAKRLAFEAVFANSAKSEFLAKLSRDIDLSISSILDRLERSGSDSGQSISADDVGVVRRISENILKKTAQIEQFVQLEDGNFVLNRDVFDLHVTLRTIENDCWSRSDDRGLQFSFECADNLPRCVWGDSERIGMIIGELLENALRFTIEGSIRVAVSWQEIDSRSGRLTVDVSDTGVGITAQDQEIIFDAFVRLDTVDTTDHRSGLGLANARAMSRLLGGSLTCQSARELGSTFRLDIPLEVRPSSSGSCDALPELPVREEEPVDEPGLIEVVLLETNVINRRVAEKLLGKLGCHVVTVTTGDMVIDYLSCQRVDIVFFDLEVDDQHVFDISCRIRESADLVSGRDVPLIALVKSDSSGITTKFRDAGITDHVVKPLSLIDLKRILTRHVIQKGERDSGTDASTAGIDVEKLFNKSELLDRLGGDETVIVELMPLFISDIADRITRVETLLTGDDRESIGNEAHTVKGASYNVSARLLGDAAYRLEKAARDSSGDADQNQKIEACFGELKQSFTTLSYHLIALEFLDLDDLPGIAVESSEGDAS